MSFTYNGDPSQSDIDFLRFMIGDTNSNAPMLQDEEYRFIIGNKTNNNERIAMAFRQAANYLGARVTKRTLGPQSEDSTKRLEYFISMAAKYEKAAKYSTAPPVPDYASEKIFDKNMMSYEG